MPYFIRIGPRNWLAGLIGLLIVLAVIFIVPVLIVVLLAIGFIIGILRLFSVKRKKPVQKHTKGKVIDAEYKVK